METEEETDTSTSDDATVVEVTVDTPDPVVEEVAPVETEVHVESPADNGSALVQIMENVGELRAEIESLRAQLALAEDAAANAAADAATAQETADIGAEIATAAVEEAHEAIAEAQPSTPTDTAPKEPKRGGRWLFG